MIRTLNLICFFLGMAVLTYAANPGGGTCCCGGWTQLSFPNLDFEDGPDPPPGGFIVYGTGAVFGGWTVTRATIDHVEGTHAGLGNGNPNGASNFVDLHGSPGFGAISYKLTNLKPGASYRIEFWTAQNGGNHSSTGTLKIAGGAWLNESWTVTISGSVLWFKVSYMFMATADMADMEFSSVGDLIYAGTLIDDISIFECPGDAEPPKVANPPEDQEYNCLDDVPAPDKLDVSDDCDLNPTISFSEKINKKDDCEQTLERLWIVTDHCNHSTKVSQTISVIDHEPPKITNQGTDKIMQCRNYSKAAFVSWLNSHGGAAASDNCKKVVWEYSFDREPRYGCDTVIVAFIASDPCGNQTTQYRNFILADTFKPVLVRPADRVLLQCSGSAKDSLQRWLARHGNAEAADSCSTLQWKNNFNGDSSSLKITVDFMAYDGCGNILSVPGVFEQLDAPDTTQVTTYNCAVSYTKKDTAYFSLPGCDSVVIRTDIGVRMDTLMVDKITCDPLQKDEIAVFTNRFACDSVVVLHYTYKAPDTTRILLTRCGQKDTTTEITVLKGSVCDSVVMTRIIPLRQDSVLMVEFSCDSARLGIRKFVLQNALGCDSTVTVETRFSQITASYQDSLVCGLDHPYADTVRLTSGSCDSLHIIRFQRKSKDTVFVSRNTCDSLSAGTREFHFTNRSGCDSAVFERLIFSGIPVTRISARTCDASMTGTDTLRLPSSAGCDSLVVTQRILVRPDTTVVRGMSCDSSVAGVRQKVLRGVFCDSVVISIIEFIRPVYSFHDIRVCTRDSVFTDTMRLFSALSCDSLVVRNFYFEPVRVEFSKTDVSCFGLSDGHLSVTSADSVKKPLICFLDGQAFPGRLAWSDLSPGRHILRIQDAEGCFSDSVTTFISEPAPFSIDIGPDLEVGKGQTISLNELSSRQFASYEWQPSSLFQCPSCRLTNALIDRDTTVLLTVHDSAGCLASDTLRIKLRSVGSAFVPNVFSPNGDLVNDRFFVAGDAQIIIDRMEIFDRWGARVFHVDFPRINEPADGWDGTSMGRSMEPAVFSYVVSLRYPDGRREIISGDLTLLR